MARTSSRDTNMARTTGRGRAPRPPHDIGALVRGFFSTLVAAVEQNTTHRIHTALMGHGKVNGRSFGPRPKQLCPVPGCKNPAAPIFGMVCSAHKDVPKAKIKEYRQARREAKVSARQVGRRRAGKAAPASAQS
jgi:hypothetical protein